MNFMFYINAIAFGIGLAMDAFSVSMANGLHEPKMPVPRMCQIAGVYCGFQILMPLVGYFCVHTIATLFESFSRFIPYIALILLAYIGGKMLIEGIKKREGDEETQSLGFGALIVQGVATSIDALSVGFTIADLSPSAACIESVIIGVTTFIVCMAGLKIGKVFGTRLAGKASIFGGIILIGIGIEIFLTGIL